MRIECPACGSTAQPQLVYLDSRSNCKRKKDTYECGCGCRFEIIFDMTAFNILPAEE